MKAALGTALGMVIAGFATMLWAAARAAGRDQVPAQASYVVSGGLIGLALVAAGSVLAHVLVARRLARRHDAAVAEVIMAMHE